MELYVEKTRSISGLSAAGERQLCIDIEYICHELAALGVNPTPGQRRQSIKSMSGALLQCAA
jgi:hypothetical protein